LCDATEKAEGKASPALVTEPQRVAIDPAEKKEIPASGRSYSNLQTKFHHQCSCRRRFDYHSGLLRTWRGPENSERYRGWIEKGILAADKLKIYITVKLSSATDAYPGPTWMTGRNLT
jgi:hypothetical protein